VLMRVLREKRGAGASPRQKVKGAGRGCVGGGGGGGVRAVAGVSVRRATVYVWCVGQGGAGGGKVACVVCGSANVVRVAARIVGRRQVEGRWAL